MREYETTVIVQPEISSSGTEAILEKLDAALDRGGATRLMCTDLGKRKLAYEIHKFQKGHYYQLSFADPGKVIPELERVLRMEESVLRFMTVLVDDDVTDLEARKKRGQELEIEQQKRAVEKAEREAEEARAREKVERQAAEEADLRAAEESKRQAAGGATADTPEAPELEAAADAAPAAEAASVEATGAAGDSAAKAAEESHEEAEPAGQSSPRKREPKPAKATRTE